MPPPAIPDAASHAPERRSYGLLLALALNAALLGSLVVSQVQLNRRLNRLEASATASGPARVHSSPGLTGERPAAAARPERIALLLAAASDPEASRRLLESLPSAERVELARTLIARPAANDRNAALGTLLQKIAEDDPAQAIALFDTMPEAGLKNSLAAGIITTWIERDPAATALWLGGDGAAFLPRDPLKRYLVGAVTRWAAFDPAAATRFFAAKPPDGDADTQTLRTVSREWARKDPAAALAWTQSLPASDPRKAPAIYGVLEGWSETDPTQAAGYVGQLSYGSNQTYGGEAAAVARRWARSDPNAAAQWALGLPDRRARLDALQQVAATWAASDTPSAARWAGALPASGDRGQIWRGIGEYWANNDPAAAEAWLSTLPAGRDRDVAVAAYAARIAPTDPAKALAWAKTMTDSGFAAEQTQALLDVWSRRDAPAARNWAAANGIVPAPPGADR